MSVQRFQQGFSDQERLYQKQATVLKSLPDIENGRFSKPVLPPIPDKTSLETFKQRRHQRPLRKSLHNDDLLQAFEENTKCLFNKRKEDEQLSLKTCITPVTDIFPEECRNDVYKNSTRSTSHKTHKFTPRKYRLESSECLNTENNKTQRSLTPFLPPSSYELHIKDDKAQAYDTDVNFGDENLSTKSQIYKEKAVCIRSCNSLHDHFQKQCNKDGGKYERVNETGNLVNYNKSLESIASNALSVSLERRRKANKDQSNSLVNNCSQDSDVVLPETSNPPRISRHLSQSEINYDTQPVKSSFYRCNLENTQETAHKDCTDTATASSRKPKSLRRIQSCNNIELPSSCALAGSKANNFSNLFEPPKPKPIFLRAQRKTEDLETLPLRQLLSKRTNTYMIKHDSDSAEIDPMDQDEVCWRYGLDSNINDFTELKPWSLERELAGKTNSDSLACAMDLEIFNNFHEKASAKRRMGICDEIEKNTVFNGLNLSWFREDMRLREILNTFIL